MYFYCQEMHFAFDVCSFATRLQTSGRRRGLFDKILFGRSNFLCATGNWLTRGGMCPLCICPLVMCCLAWGMEPIWKLSGPPAPERMMAGRATEPVSTFPIRLNCCCRSVDLKHMIWFHSLLLCLVRLFNGNSAWLGWINCALLSSLGLIWYQNTVMIESTDFSMTTHTLTVWGTRSPQAWSTPRLPPGQSDLYSFSLGT